MQLSDEYEFFHPMRVQVSNCSVGVGVCFVVSLASAIPLTRLNAACPAQACQPNPTGGTSIALALLADWVTSERLSD